MWSSLSSAAGLGEYKIRDLNDEINKLLRLKSRWEDRIKELGGADWKKIAPKMLDREGREIPGAWGYKCVVWSFWCVVMLCYTGTLEQRVIYLAYASSSNQRRLIHHIRRVQSL